MAGELEPSPTTALGQLPGPEAGCSPGTEASSHPLQQLPRLQSRGSPQGLQLPTEASWLGTLPVPEQQGRPSRETPALPQGLLPHRRRASFAERSYPQRAIDGAGQVRKRLSLKSMWMETHTPIHISACKLINNFTDDKATQLIFHPSHTK